ADHPMRIQRPGVLCRTHSASRSISGFRRRRRPGRCLVISPPSFSFGESTPITEWVTTGGRKLVLWAHWHIALAYAQHLHPSLSRLVQCGRARELERAG